VAQKLHYLAYFKSHKIFQNLFSYISINCITKEVVVGYFSVANFLIFRLKPHACVMACHNLVFSGLGDHLGF